MADKKPFLKAQKTLPMSTSTKKKLAVVAENIKG